MIEQKRRDKTRVGEEPKGRRFKSSPRNQDSSAIGR